MTSPRFSGIEHSAFMHRMRHRAARSDQAAKESEGSAPLGARSCCEIHRAQGASHGSSCATAGADDWLSTPPLCRGGGPRKPDAWTIAYMVHICPQYFLGGGIGEHVVTNPSCERHLVHFLRPSSGIQAVKRVHPLVPGQTLAKPAYSTRQPQVQFHLQLTSTIERIPTIDKH